MSLMPRSHHSTSFLYQKCYQLQQLDAAQLQKAVWPLRYCTLVLTQLHVLYYQIDNTAQLQVLQAFTDVLIAISDLSVCKYGPLFQSSNC